MDKDKLKKLPVWAQQEITARDYEIKRLKNLIEEIEWKAKETDFGVRLPSDSIYKSGHLLPKQSRILINLRKQSGTTAHLEIMRETDDTINISQYGEGKLIIRPVVSNSINISVEDR